MLRALDITDHELVSDLLFVLVLFALLVYRENGHGRTRYEDKALEAPIYRHALFRSNQGRLLPRTAQQLDHAEDEHHEENLNLLARLALRALSLDNSCDLLTFPQVLAIATINLAGSLVFHGLAPLAHKERIAPPVLLGELFVRFFFDGVINRCSMDRFFLFHQLLTGREVSIIGRVALSEQNCRPKLELIRDLGRNSACRD